MRASHSNASQNSCNRQARAEEKEEEELYSETRADSKEEMQAMESHHQFIITEVTRPGCAELERSAERHLDRWESFATTNTRNLAGTSRDKFSLPSFWNWQKSAEREWFANLQIWACSALAEHTGHWKVPEVVDLKSRSKSTGY
jgi:hypothetical protein